MKKLLFLISLSLMLSVFPAGSSVGTDTQKAKVVYICTGKYATSYHRLKDCAAGNCKAIVRAVSESEAIGMGRKPCGRCKP